SRQALGLIGEVAWPVPPLALPDPRTAIPASVAGQVNLTVYSAVRLFVERAQAACPSFQLTPDNSWAVVQACCRLDGIPLAIELAAARLKLLSVQQVTERLGNRF